MAGRLTQAQILRLVTAIDPGHVENKRGMSYMAQFEVRAELTRLFGYGNWDTQVESMELLYEKQILKGGGDPQYPAKGTAPEYWVTAYKAAVRLTIRDYWGETICSFVEYHAEENAPLPNRGEAHAMAMTSVESYALRRAAIGLGDRLGLGLYNKGSVAPLVLRTLQLDDPESPQFFRADRSSAAPAQKRPDAPPAEQSQSRQMAGFKAAQEKVQAGNAAARDPYLERVQSNMKVDVQSQMNDGPEAGS